jgi:asparagine N-glycosylation enzyme membrane subunit Stt3
MLNSAKTILDFIGLGSLTTFLLTSLASNPLTFNISILLFSTIYVFISLRKSRFVYPYVKTFNSHRLIVRKFPFMVKLTYTVSLVVLYVLFLLSFYIPVLSDFPAFLVGKLSDY